MQHVQDRFCPDHLRDGGLGSRGSAPVTHAERAKRAREIVRRHGAGETAGKLAAEYGLASGTVYGLIRKYGNVITLSRTQRADRAKCMAYRYHAGERPTVLAKEFGVHYATIHRAANLYAAQNL